MLDFRGIMSHSHAQAHTEHDAARLIAVVSYLTLIGWLVALVFYGNYKSALARFHLRQSLGLIVTAALLSFVPLIGWALNFVVAVFWLLAIFHAYKGECYPVPLLGNIFQEHLDFIT